MIAIMGNNAMVEVARVLRFSFSGRFCSRRANSCGRVEPEKIVRSSFRRVATSQSDVMVKVTVKTCAQLQNNARTESRFPLTVRVVNRECCDEKML
jgi:hypothetical protein